MYSVTTTSILKIVLLFSISSPFRCHSTTTRSMQKPHQPSPPPTFLECELYIAESTIPNAGLGIFTAIPKKVGDTVGNGDVCFPVLELAWHNGVFFDSTDNKDPTTAATTLDDENENENSRNTYKTPYEYTRDGLFSTPFDDYGWDGNTMGLGNEADGDLLALWPGLDCAVNSLIPLQNVQRSFPTHPSHEDDPSTIERYMPHRMNDHGAGSITPYRSSKVPTMVSRDIPAGGELFKSYGDAWFKARKEYGGLPLENDFRKVQILLDKYEAIANKYHNQLGYSTSSSSSSPSPLYDLLLEIQAIWKSKSRTLNALPQTYEDLELSLQTQDVTNIYQANATRSIEWLQRHGRCIDHIRHDKSTIPGAGEGAFAKRRLPKDTIITSSPLIHVSDSKLFDMYDELQIFKEEEEGEDEIPSSSSEWIRSEQPVGKQIITNYCFGHNESTLLLIPYGASVNYINHASSSFDDDDNNNSNKPNVRIQWPEDGTMNHNSSWLLKTPEQMMEDLYTMKGIHLAIDYVAIRDIEEREELFIDYGDTWHKAWQNHIENWVRPEEVTTAADWNGVFRDVPILTIDEWKKGVYPKSIQIRCHVDLIYNTTNDENYNDENWVRYDTDNYEYQMIYGLPCDLLERNDENKTYTVNITLDKLVFFNETRPLSESFQIFIDENYKNTPKNEDNDARFTLRNVPRQAIFFLDAPGESDLYIKNAFRQPIGLPDSMMPEAWKNIKNWNGNNVEENQKTATDSSSSTSTNSSGHSNKDEL